MPKTNAERMAVYDSEQYIRRPETDLVINTIVDMAKGTLKDGDVRSFWLTDLGGGGKTCELLHLKALASKMGIDVVYFDLSAEEGVALYGTANGLNQMKDTDAEMGRHALLLVDNSTHYEVQFLDKHIYPLVEDTPKVIIVRAGRRQDNAYPWTNSLAHLHTQTIELQAVEPTEMAKALGSQGMSRHSAHVIKYGGGYPGLSRGIAESGAMPGLKLELLNIFGDYEKAQYYKEALTPLIASRVLYANKAPLNTNLATELKTGGYVRFEETDFKPAPQLRHVLYSLASIENLPALVSQHQEALSRYEEWIETYAGKVQYKALLPIWDQEAEYHKQQIELLTA